MFPEHSTRDLGGEGGGNGSGEGERNKGAEILYREQVEAERKQTGWLLFLSSSSIFSS